MVIRVFSAIIREGLVDEFLRLAQSVSVPLVKEAAGVIDFYAGMPEGEAAREFVMVTTWRSLEDAKRFAGGDHNTPVIPEEETELIESAQVRHYQAYAGNHFSSQFRKEEHGNNDNQAL